MRQWEQRVGKQWNRPLIISPVTHFKNCGCKRGDIGNTSLSICPAFLKHWILMQLQLLLIWVKTVFAVFLNMTDKWTIVLGLTSNKGADDFEMKQLANGELLYEKDQHNCSMGQYKQFNVCYRRYQASQLANIRKIIPDHFYWFPSWFPGRQFKQLLNMEK